MALSEQILQFLSGYPDGMTAREIAKALGAGISSINSALYSDPSKFEHLTDNTWRVRHASALTLNLMMETAPLAEGEAFAEAAETPACPVCGGSMMVRTARRGPNAGGQFYGCRGYPNCRGIRPIAAAKETASKEPSSNAEIEPPADLGEPPTCPKCAQIMRARQARKGSWFWGCPGFPTCRGTRPIAGESRDMDADSSASAPWTSLNRPRDVRAASIASTHRLVYVEGTYVPRAVARWSDQWISEPQRRALCQWKLNVPLEIAAHGFAPPDWLTVARSLLRRGRLMPIADRLALDLAHAVGFNDVPNERDVRHALAEICDLAPLAPSNLGCAESEEERTFYNDVLGAMVGPHMRGWTFAQPLLGSLTGDVVDTASNQRTDFAVLHPRGLHLVVEIDGQQHDTRARIDAERDQSLRQAGFEVVRIPASEIRDRDGPALRPLLTRLRALSSTTASALSPAARWLLLCKRAHQIQLATLELIALIRPAIDAQIPIGVNISLDPGTAALVQNEADFAASVLNDLSSLLSDLAGARGDRAPAMSPSPHGDALIRLDFDPSADALPDTAYVTDGYVPVPVAAGLPRGTMGRSLSPNEACCERMLERLFGFASFREGQYAALERALQGLDSIVLLPTGSGKSLAFQLASLLRSGICIVVDPILSLIEDQIENLRAAGIDRVTQITGSLSPTQRGEYLELLKRGEFLFCYVAPERFQDEAFRSSLQTMTAHSAVSLVAIDEAHCVSEWGHDFRPAYLNLARNAREFCRSTGGVPPLMALTGTASHSVLKDVQRELGISQYEAIITPKSFDRPELSFDLVRCRTEEKNRRLHGVLLGLPEQFAQDQTAFFEVAGDRTSAGLIFCPHTNGEHGVVSVASTLSSLLQRPVPFYSGQSPKGFDASTWAEKKRQTATGFKRNNFPVMVCTKAFGMGIDKPNVRYTIHYNLPASIESFYQEAGRAGRDRRRARCLVLFSNDDERRTQTLLAPTTSVDTVREIIGATKRYTSDDVTRMLYFHTNSFRGIEAEMENIDAALDALEPLTEPHRVRLRFDTEKKAEEERALHRLLVIGVIRDYTVDYKQQEFGVSVTGATAQDVLERFHRYLSGYQRQRASTTIAKMRGSLDRPFREFVREVIEEMIQFVYEVIERGRRRNLAEMLRILESAKSGEDVRRDVLDYLQKSKFSDSINELTSLEAAGLAGAVEIVGNIRSSIDAAEVRGETARALGAYPDFPGLLLLRSAAESLTNEPDPKAVFENASAAAQMASVTYGIDLNVLCDAALRSVLLLADDRLEMARTMLGGIMNGIDDRRAAARYMMRLDPDRFVTDLVAVLMQELRDGVDALIER